jgi:hypothetical protein
MDGWLLYSGIKVVCFGFEWLIDQKNLLPAVSSADLMDERGNFPLIEKLLNNST